MCGRTNAETGMQERMQHGCILGGWSACDWPRFLAVHVKKATYLHPLYRLASPEKRFLIDLNRWMLLMLSVKNICSIYTRGSQRDVAVAYLGWAIAPSYMSPNAVGGGCCGVSANEYSCAHGSQINFGDLIPYLTYDLYWPHRWKVLNDLQPRCNVCYLF